MNTNATDTLHKTTDLGPHQVPELWRYMLPNDVFEYEIPSERDSSCSNCPRIATEGYRPDYRCCTYLPRMPNYMLGLALEQPASATVVEKLLELGHLTPEGLTSSPQINAQYNIEVSTELFGRSETFLCPFLRKSDGYCGAYPYRNGVCSTFFCSSNHGDKGEKFWEELQTLVSQCELVLSQWALDQCGFDLKHHMETLDSLDIHNVSRDGKGFNEETLQKLWGKWHGREFELLRQCAAHVRSKRDDLWAIANHFEILEPVKFENAALNLIPEEYRDESDQEFSEEQEFVAPHTIYKDLERAYNKLWALPGRSLQLNPKVTIRPIDRTDPEEAQFDHKPWRVEITAPESKRDRFYTTTDTAEFLQAFQGSQTLDADFEHIWQSKLDPVRTATEWFGRHVLRPNQSKVKPGKPDWM